MSYLYDPYTERFDFLEFGQIKNTNLLDIGVGKAVLSIIAAKKMHCHVTCVDLNINKLERGRKLVADAGLSTMIQFEYQNVCGLSYYDNSFPVVACFSTLHHLSSENRGKALHEMFRVAKDKLIISELTLKGAKYFDEVLHPEENHCQMHVPLEWVKNQFEASVKILISERHYTYFLSILK